MKYWMSAAALALGTAPALADDFSALYVFGDSLVDAGNVSLATGGANPDASLGYVAGRFTNGFNYPDLLSIALYGAPTVPSLAGGTNYAFGGARVVANGDALPDLALQISAYLGAAGGAGDPNALYILNAGGNDLFALAAGDTGGLSGTDYVGALVSQYAGAVDRLEAAGARNILITGIPSTGDPAVFAVEAALQTALNGVMLETDTTLYRYSYLSFLGRIRANPAAFGLPAGTDFTTPCLLGETPGPGIDCTGYFLFDPVHPTAAVQAAAYADINAQFALAPIPEPKSWAMLIAGFAAIGAVLRRRRRALTMVHG